MPRADPQVASQQWRPPAGLPAVLALNALIGAALSAGFLWAALSERTGSALYLAIAIGGAAFAGWLARMSYRESQARLVADRDGIALGVRGRSRYGWTDIGRFEVAALLDHAQEPYGHCGVMVLCDGERVVLRALRTDAPFRECSREDIRDAVHTLNELHRDQRAAPAVLESAARC